MVEMTCPVCRRVWTPTPFDDCLLPACGCYGDEIGPDTPCESCGLSHAWTCPKIKGHERRAQTPTPNLVEMDLGSDTEVHRGKSWKKD